MMLMLDQIVQVMLVGIDFMVIDSRQKYSLQLISVFIVGYSWFMLFEVFSSDVVIIFSMMVVVRQIQGFIVGFGLLWVVQFEGLFGYCQCIEVFFFVQWLVIGGGLIVVGCVVCCVQVWIVCFVGKFGQYCVFLVVLVCEQGWFYQVVQGQVNVVVLFLLQQVFEIGLYIGMGEVVVVGCDVLQQCVYVCFEFVDECVDGFIDQ